MASDVLQFKDIVKEDQLGCAIARNWVTWSLGRSMKVAEWQELRKYIYATDTRKTTNSTLPWKNTTTIPKLTQIRDNLYANYMAAMFPKRKWLTWEADTKDANSMAKRSAILNYMYWVVSQNEYKQEIARLVLDYIDYGNAIAMSEWVDHRSDPADSPGPKAGFIGPRPMRINPLDIVFNPTASTFSNAPKIIRSLISIGELKEMLERMSKDEDTEDYNKIFDYLRDYRNTILQSGTELTQMDEIYQVDGFTSFRHYLEGEYVEMLTFYGDIYDWESNKFYRNAIIKVVDRHCVISNKPNPSVFDKAPIFHVGWRVRQDNLWAMGPLDNLVGMQYRVDHIENLKADVFDLIAFPVLKVKGFVEDFNWGPFEKIYIGDEGDVEMLAPPFQVLQANVEIQNLTNLMEEMAGSPKEAMGFRTPGEKTAYEVQRLENAASRIFTNKIVQFEEQLVEKLLNAMLEQARRNVSGLVSIPVFDDELKFQSFMDLTPSDIVGAGKLKPIAARHFAERAELVQNLTNFYNSAIGQDNDVRMHLSSVQLAKLFEAMFDIEDYEIVVPYVRIGENAQAQRLIQTHTEQLQMEAQTSAGISPDDYDKPINDTLGAVNPAMTGLARTATRTDNALPVG
jgi:hypothetical protein